MYTFLIFLSSWRLKGFQVFLLFFLPSWKNALWVTLYCFLWLCVLNVYYIAFLTMSHVLLKKEVLSSIVVLGKMFQKYFSFGYELSTVSGQIELHSWLEHRFWLKCHLLAKTNKIWILCHLEGHNFFQNDSVSFVRMRYLVLNVNYIAFLTKCHI